VQAVQSTCLGRALDWPSGHWGPAYSCEQQVSFAHRCPSASAMLHVTYMTYMIYMSACLLYEPRCMCLHVPLPSAPLPE
jgi:hypothetical protein